METSINPNLINNTVINPLANDTQTSINPQLNYNQTGINPALNGTQINSALMNSVQISTGTLLCDGYMVQQKLDTQTGEADLYICIKDSAYYVAKVYRRQVAVKDEIIDKLIDINCPYIARVFSTGTYNGFPVEILPYYRFGSLRTKRCTYMELKTHIIPSLNEGLHVLHENGIIHKDLKPSNIMLNDNQIDVAIIDFGISSVRDAGNTVVVTQTGMTPEYSAPETFRNLFLAESDYYSLGITIYELFCGRTPYQGMSPEEIEKYVAVQHIPFPEDMPDDLRNLISALTYNDITNRKNKSNPNRRWGYEEVKRWCSGIEQVIPGEGIGNTIGSIAPYKFQGEMYDDKAELVKALAKDWEEGKKHLYRGLLSGYFKAIDPEMASDCIDAEEMVEQGADEDIVFLQTLYKIDKSCELFFWKGKSYESLVNLGKAMLQRLWDNDDSVDPFLSSILKNKVLSTYCHSTDVTDQRILNAVDGVEKTYVTLNNSKEDRQCVYYIMAFMLSGIRTFYIRDKQFGSVEDLTEYMKELLDDSYDSFSSFCKDLLDESGELNPQFEAWLIVKGKQNEIKQWRDTLF